MGVGVLVEVRGWQGDLPDKTPFTPRVPRPQPGPGRVPWVPGAGTGRAGDLGKPAALRSAGSRGRAGPSSRCRPLRGAAPAAPAAPGALLRPDPPPPAGTGARGDTVSAERCGGGSAPCGAAKGSPDGTPGTGSPGGGCSRWGGRGTVVAGPVSPSPRCAARSRAPESRSPGAAAAVSRTATPHRPRSPCPERVPGLLEGLPALRPGTGTPGGGCSAPPAPPPASGTLGGASHSPTGHRDPRGCCPLLFPSTSYRDTQGGCPTPLHPNRAPGPPGGLPALQPGTGIPAGAAPLPLPHS